MSGRKENLTEFILKYIKEENVETHLYYCKHRQVAEKLADKIDEQLWTNHLGEIQFG